MSLGDDLIIIFSRRPLGCKLRELTWSEYRKSSGPAPDISALRVTLSRLKKRGLVRNNKLIWRLTSKGREYLNDRFNFHASYPRPKNPEKRMIVTFDIPEKQRRKRVWLRTELINLNFELLQKSVWLGPAPLPSEFVKALAQLDLLPHIRFFEAKEADII